MSPSQVVGQEMLTTRALTKRNKHYAEFQSIWRPLVVDSRSTLQVLELAVAGVALSHQLFPPFSLAMESKKRPHADDGGHSRAKKRAVSDELTTPSHPNGTIASHSDEPKEGDDIEVL